MACNMELEYLCSSNDSITGVIQGITKTKPRACQMITLGGPMGEKSIGSKRRIIKTIHMRIAVMSACQRI